jgi:hypothetical protein
MDKQKTIGQIFNEKLDEQKKKEPKTIGQGEINSLLEMYRCHIRFGTSLGSFLSRSALAWPEWNISENHVGLFKYIEARCGDFSKTET